MWRVGLVVMCVSAVAGADVAPRPRACGEGTTSSMSGPRDVPLDTTVIVATNQKDMGPYVMMPGDQTVEGKPIAGTHLAEIALHDLQPDTVYNLWSERHHLMATFTTGTARTKLLPPAMPEAHVISAPAPKVAVDNPDGVVAYLVTLVGTRESQTYLVPFSSQSGLIPMARNCVDEAGMGAGDTDCIELVAIDRGGQRSKPARICGDLHIPGMSALVNGLPIIAASLALGSGASSKPPRMPDPNFERRPTPLAPVSVVPPPPRRRETVAAWLLALAALGAALVWMFASRLRAVRRFTRSDVVEIDRAAAAEELGPRRAVFAGASVGAAASVTLAFVAFDARVLPLAAIVALVGAAALVCVRAAWNAHRCLDLATNPDIMVTTDRRGHVFLAHGSDLLRYAGLSRAAIARLSALPEARVVSR